MKKMLITISMIMFTLHADAQSNVSETIFNDPLMPFYALLVLLGVVFILVVVVAITMVKVLNTLSEKLAIEKSERLGVTYKPQPSWWSRTIQSLNASVPVEDEKEIILDHSYDGIRELDNHLPPWWKWLFYATIVWAAVYVVAYHFTDSLPLQDEEYEQEITLAEAAKQKLIATQPRVAIDENNLVYNEDKAILDKGRELYTINCSPCHKADGGGSIGPNLTDEYWLHGGGVGDIYGIIKNGVPEKGMISWANVLSPEQIRDVSFFIVSIKGSNPLGAKSPQGDLYKPAPLDTKSDSTKARASLE